MIVVRRVPTAWEVAGEWQLRAACRGMDTELFFPLDDQPGPHRHDREQAAKRICLGCPVREACLNWALHACEPDGVWGGLTRHERDTVAPPTIRLTTPTPTGHFPPAGTPRKGSTMTTVEVVRGYATANAPRDVVDTRTRQVIAALLDLEMTGCGLSDSVVRADPARHRLEIEVVVDADTVAEATSTAEWCIQTAMYAADGPTTEWFPERFPPRTHSH